MVQALLCLTCLNLAVPALDDLFPLMRKNAEPYVNIEAHYTKRVVSPKLGTGRDPSHVARWLQETYRAVWQGPLVHYAHRTDLEFYDGSKKGFDTEYGYDNEFTRINYQGALGNLDDGKRSPYPCIPPHNLGMPELGEHALPDFLQLGPSVKLDPRLSRITRIESTVDGTTVVAGLTCIKIKSDAYVGDDKKPRGRYLYWIAPERNYLVVRSEQYLVSASLDVPIVEYETSDWRELAAGIWLPFRCSVKQHQVSAATNPNEWEIESTATYVVDFAKLNPKYPIEFFRNVELPKDALVYIIKGGEIVETRVNGQVVEREVSQPAK